MKNYNFQVEDILHNMVEVFRKKGLIITLLFIIQSVFALLMYFKFENTYSVLLNPERMKDSKAILEAYGPKIFLLILLTTTLSIIIYGLLTKITYKEIILYKIRKPIITQFLHYFLMYIVFFLIMFVGFIIYFIFIGIFVSFGPLGLLLVIGLSIGLLIIMFYYMGYYRFIPYIAMTEGSDGVFNKTKRCIKGHLVFSIILIILAGGITSIFNRLEANAFASDRMILFIVLLIISQFISFLFSFLDIVFVFTGLKYHNLRYSFKNNTDDMDDNDELFHLSDI
ncbi:hypothetical protein KHQ81_04180 [Mycoplasmatota bacterium]|nr:hypothetical protein KHQ81_04180 [Mycoplasmatota bacterium]